MQNFSDLVQGEHFQIEWVVWMGDTKSGVYATVPRGSIPTGIVKGRHS